jgi:adenylate cyclase
MTAHILFVDDEQDLEVLVLQRFRRQIRANEIEFIFARDGVEALERLSSRSDIDLVVTDISMPRMDGLTLLEKLQDHDTDLLTIIVSAYGDMSNIRTAMNRGAFDFLTKPIDFQDLEATVAKTVRQTEAIRDAKRRQLAAEQAYQSLSRYFSPSLAEQLARDDCDAELGGQRREVAAMFTDIAGFTGLAETLKPSLLTELLNSYLSGMTEIVFEHEGTIAKIVGDALHVLFGAPGDQPDRAERAVACSLALDAFSEGFRKEWSKRGIEVGVTRIGLHSGSAVVGNFGSGRIFDYTAYGDTINIAARLEAANKQLGTRICVSQSVASQIEGFRGRPIGDLRLRGRREALRAFEPIGAKDAGSEWHTAYLQAFEQLEKREAAAVPAFASLVGAHSDDALASFHLRRLLNGGTGIEIEMT